MVYHVYDGLLLSCCPYLSRLKPSFQVTSFYFYHLWNYDRFKCLRYMILPVDCLQSKTSLLFRWNNGCSSQAFKRLMMASNDSIDLISHPLISSQYSYLAALPLFTIYAFGNVVIKYNVGYMNIPGYGGMYPPKPDHPHY
jgi:hypothetical protein